MKLECVGMWMAGFVTGASAVLLAVKAIQR